MKSIITVVLLLLAGLCLNAQLKVSAGAAIKTTGGASIVLQDLDLDNDGTINQAPGDGGCKFAGTITSSIKGLNMPVIGILEINKTGGAKLLLNRNISVNSSINFITGNLDLNNNNILLSATGYIAGESENNRVIGSDGGFIEITQDMNAPVSVNPGNLGAIITSPANLGAVTIRRGNLPQSGTGLSSGIQRYYLISPANNSNLDATLRLKYFDAELNTQNENNLVLYKSNDNGSNWNNMSQSSRNSNSNYVEKTGLSNLSLLTLAEDNVQSQDGVTGLVFSGTRNKSTEVKLNWSSQTETNLSGYQVQRRLNNEISFTDKSFVNSAAPGGNSTVQLSYQNTDPNSYTDTSYYRLKIVRLDNTYTYSDVIAVAAKTKGGGSGGSGGGGNGGGGNPHNAKAPGSETNQDIANKITIGPNPNNGNFWFRVSGLEKETITSIYSIDGKLVKQFNVVNLQQQQVSGMRSGIYILKVPGFETKKIIVNGNTIIQNPESNQSGSTLKN